MFDRLATEDIFISYSRADASAYADGLASGLLTRGFSVFVDRLGTDASETIPPTLLAKLRGASMLLVVGSPGAAASGFVGEEAKVFSEARGSSRVLPIDFEGALARAPWYAAVVGIAVEPESIVALTTGVPSPRVLDRVERAFQYTRSKVRLRRYTLGAMASLVILGTLTALAAFMARSQFEAASLARDEARRFDAVSTAARRRASEAETAASQAEEHAERAMSQARVQEAAASAASLRAAEAAQLAAEQERIAVSRQLAVVSAGFLSSHLDAAALWAVEAFDTSPTREAREALDAVLAYEPRLIRVLGDEGRHTEAVAAGDHGLVALATAAGTVPGEDAGRRIDLIDVAAGGRLLQRVPAAASMRVTRLLVGERYLVIEFRWRNVLVIEHASGKRWELPEPPQGASLQAALASDGTLLTLQSRTGGGSAQLTRWRFDADVPAPVRVGEISLSTPVEALSGTGRVVVREGGALHVVDGASFTSPPKVVMDIPVPPVPPNGSAQSVRFLAGGALLALDSLSDSRFTTEVWDLERRERLLEPVPGRLIAASAESDTLLVELADGTLQPMDAHRAQDRVGPLRHPGPRGAYVGLSPNGRWTVLDIFRDRALALDLSHRHALGQPILPDAGAASLAFLADGRLAAASPAGVHVGPWSALPANDLDITAFGVGRPGFVVQRHDKSLAWTSDLLREPDAGVGLPPSGDALLAASARGRKVAMREDAGAGRMVMRVWESRRGDVYRVEVPRGKREVRYFKGMELAPPRLNAVAFAPDGEAAVLGLSNDPLPLRLWRSGQRTAKEALPGHESDVTALAGSPDGVWLASGSTRLVLHRWTRPQQAVWERDVGREIVSLAFSDDGRMLAAGREDGLIQLWDTEAGIAYRFDLDQRGSIVSLAFSPDGLRLASSSADGGVWLWNLEVDDWRRRACLLAGRELAAREWSIYRPGEPYRPACAPR